MTISSLNLEDDVQPGYILMRAGSRGWGSGGRGVAMGCYGNATRPRARYYNEGCYAKDLRLGKWSSSSRDALKPIVV